jgi:hypothetical protein
MWRADEAERGTAGVGLVAPQSGALFNRDRGDEQRGNWVQDAEPGRRADQCDQRGRGLNGAQEVLDSLSGGCGRSQLGAEAELGPTERRHQDDR